MHIISQLCEVILCESAVSEKSVEGKIIHGFIKAFIWVSNEIT